MSLRFSLMRLTFLCLSSIAFAKQNLLATKDFNQQLDSVPAAKYSKKNGETYNQKNWLNPVLHNIYMANNRSETAQFRVGLSNLSRQSSGRLRYVDMLGDQPVDWDKMNDSSFVNQIQKYHSILGFETTNFNVPDAKVVLLFSSASHNLISASMLQLLPDLTKAGYIVVMLEYPGYGASMGTPSMDNWNQASTGAIEYIRRILPEHRLYLVGHSIGSAVALEAAAIEAKKGHPEMISGVVSNAGIYTLEEASKDSSKFFLSDEIAPLVTKLLVKHEKWNSENSLGVLARVGVPVLILQGQQDQSVSFRHFGLFTQKLVQLQSEHPNFKASSQSFAEGTHEDIYTNANYGVYSEIWQAIQGFLKQN